jgi:hypothetical protein
VPSIVAPVGAPISENVSVCAGRSAVGRVAVNVYGASSGIVALAGTFAIAGAAFTSVTVSVIAASVFACRRSPAPRTDSCPAPAPRSASTRTHRSSRRSSRRRRADQRERQRLRGQSLSVAVAVNVYGASSGIVALAGTSAIAGAAFASVTSP